MSVFGQRLKSLLVEKRIQQKELALQLGMSDRTVNSYCQGNSFPPLSTLSEICKILNVSADYLIGTIDEYKTLDGGQDEVAEDILMIRRSYVSMSGKERELIKELVQTIIKP